MLDSNSDRIQNFAVEDYSSTPDKRLSEKQSIGYSSLSFTDDENVSPYRGKVASLSDNINSYIKQASEAYKEISSFFKILIQARNNFLKSAEREVDREISKKKYEIERQKENLLFITKELQNHEKTLVDALNTVEGPTMKFLTILKERAEKTFNLFKAENIESSMITIDLDIVSKKVVNDIKEKNQFLIKENRRLKLKSHEMTPDTARIRPRHLEDFGDIGEDIDLMVCERLQEILNVLQDFSQSNYGKERVFQDKKMGSSGFDPLNALKCVELLKKLEQNLVKTLTQAKNPEVDKAQIRKVTSNSSFRLNLPKDLKQEDLFSLQKELESLNLSNQALNRLNHEQAQEISEIRSKLAQSNQENYLLKQKYSLSKTHENELNIALRNQELSFEEKISEIKSETQPDMQKMQDLMEKLFEYNNLKAKLDETEDQLRKAQMIIENSSNSGFERELENVRKIYNDKYEELFKLTSLQIFDLEQKLMKSTSSESIIYEEIKANVRKEEQKLREKEFVRLNNIHNRELKIIQTEFEEFLMKTKTEVGKLGKLVEKAIKSSDLQVLGSLKDEISVFQDKLYSKAKNIKEESFSLSFDDERVCKRCGLNDNKSR